MSKIRSYTPLHKKAPAGRSFNGRAEWDAMKKSQEWKDYRERFLEKNPRCYNCGIEASVVDHLRPHKGDKKLFEQLDNHIPLCEVCHNRVTGLFDKRFVAGGSIQSKIKWLQMNRLAKRLEFRVKVLPYFSIGVTAP